MVKRFFGGHTATLHKLREVLEAKLEKIAAKFLNEVYGELDFKVITINEVIGQTLAIQLPQLVLADTWVSVRVIYSTQPTSMALSWMTPEQTSGKKLPYLFSQCESINCRSVAPMQDTPSGWASKRSLNYQSTLTDDTDIEE